MTIGRFAHLSGVSAHTLRHYDDVGLLRPAAVDPSGYRKYQARQIRQARLIRALRWIDLPIEGIMRVLGAPEDEAARDVLGRHRNRLERQRSLTDAQVRDLDRFLDQGLELPMMTVPSGCRPVQFMIAIRDKPAAVAFYQAVAGPRYQVTRRTSAEDRSSFWFGQYGSASFFLMRNRDHRTPRRPLGGD